MLRQISYRTAFFVFAVAALWLVAGGVMLWSPIPGALDISWEFFGAWVVLFFLVSAAGGALLTIAALNDLVARPPRRPSPAPQSEVPPRWASASGQPATSRTSPRRPG